MTRFWIRSTPTDEQLGISVSLSLTYRWWLLKDRVFVVISSISASPTSSDSEMLLAKALSSKYANVKAIWPS